MQNIQALPLTKMTHIYSNIFINSGLDKVSFPKFQKGLLDNA